MAGIRSLHELLKSMEPRRRPGEYVFVVVDDERARELPYEALVREEEGVTLVMRREVVDAAGLSYDFVAAWITLTVHSDLTAVGLTAAFATALGAERISCNVIAGYRHDHILIPVERVQDALDALTELGRRTAG